MNKEIIKEISTNLNIKDTQVEATLKLLEEGNTIPFIARYRKEVTSNLDEEQIRSINTVYIYQINLLKRKEDVIRLILEKEMLTDELKQQIMQANKLVDVEDLYRPYKEKKKTKATEAIALGLKPLAQEIMLFPINGTLKNLANKYVNEQVPTITDAINGAKYIIAEDVSDNASIRKWIRMNTYIYGNITSKLKKKAVDSEFIYQMYYDYSSPIKAEKPHRILALNRGEKAGILTVSIEIDTKRIMDYLYNKIILNKESFVSTTVIEAIDDAYKRLISPSIDREIRSDLTETAEVVAIDNFGKNLEKLLLQPPMKDKIVMGFDPAYRTGCKLAIIDHTGKKLAIKVIYPHEPKNEVSKSKSILLELIDKYMVDIIAIGNGTASRESVLFVAETIKEAKRKVEYIIVSEAGASVYSASKLAIEEFPDLHVEERSAISIGRRLQDPLAELVKIDPESIGVGLYQHDVPARKLSESLEFVVTCAVNSVGVNLNTASSFLLKFVSGLTKKNIEKIILYREDKGKILSREELKKKKLLTDKTYEQAVGFLRIVDGKNPLDVTDIHPESYETVNKLLTKLGFTLKDIGTEQLITALKTADISYYAKELDISTYTLEDIFKSLKSPTRDPRDEKPSPLLRSDVLQLNDLKVGMLLQGTIRNVAPFGVFIDIGLKNDGLAHISKLSNHFIKDPMEVVNVGDIVDCYVDEILLDKNKVSLSLLKPKEGI